MMLKPHAGFKNKRLQKTMQNLTISIHAEQYVLLSIPNSRLLRPVLKGKISFSQIYVVLIEYSGSVELANFPSFEGEIPIPQHLELSALYGHTKPGSVYAMEWSSDGYALAVGWDNGWAIWSVGGRCLAWGFGVEEEVNNTKFVFFTPSQLTLMSNMLKIQGLVYVWHC